MIKLCENKIRCVVCACGKVYPSTGKADHFCNYTKIFHGTEFEGLIELLKKGKPF